MVVVVGVCYGLAHTRVDHDEVVRMTNLMDLVEEETSAAQCALKGNFPEEALKSLDTELKVSRVVLDHASKEEDLPVGMIIVRNAGDLAKKKFGDGSFKSVNDTLKDQQKKLMREMNAAFLTRLPPPPPPSRPPKKTLMDIFVDLRDRLCGEEQITADETHEINMKKAQQKVFAEGLPAERPSASSSSLEG